MLVPDADPSFWNWGEFREEGGLPLGVGGGVPWHAEVLELRNEPVDSRARRDLLEIGLPVEVVPRRYLLVRALPARGLRRVRGGVCPSCRRLCGCLLMPRVGGTFGALASCQWRLGLASLTMGRAPLRGRR